MTRPLTQLALHRELAERARLVSSEEAVAVGKSMGATKAAIEMALARLVRNGSLTRVRRGLYLVNVPGMPPVHPFVIASALVDGGAVSGWAALHHHGLTEQVPRVIEVTTTKRTRIKSAGGSRRLIEVEGERFHIVTVAPARMFGVEQLWLGGERARIFDRERALLDLFVRPRELGGLETALSLLEEHHRALDLEGLVRYAVTLDCASVIKRVGWALERIGASVSVEPLLAHEVQGYALLDPSRPARGPWRSRWHLRENLGRET